MLGIEPPGYFDPPTDYPDKCEDCGKHCREDAGLCDACIEDAEHDATCEPRDDVWHDRSSGLWPDQ